MNSNEVCTLLAGAPPSLELHGVEISVFRQIPHPDPGREVGCIVKTTPEIVVASAKETIDGPDPLPERTAAGADVSSQSVAHAHYRIDRVRQVGDRTRIDELRISDGSDVLTVSTIWVGDEAETASDSDSVSLDDAVALADWLLGPK